MEKAITDRQHKLNILKKFKESEKWKLISEDLKNKREALWNAVLDFYGLPDENGEEFTEFKKYNEKNKAIWACNAITDFKNLLWDSEAELLIKEYLDENLKNAENYIKYAHWTSLSTFRSPTDVEYTETDKLCIKANLLQDNIKVIDRLIDTYSKEEEKTDIPKTTEDNSDLE